MLKIKEIYLPTMQKYQIVVCFTLLLMSCESDLNKNLIEVENIASEEVNLEDEDKFNSLYAQGYQNIQMGDIDNAVKQLNEAYLIKQNDPHLNYALGYVYSAKGNDSLAIFYFTEAISFKNDHSGAYFSRGVSYHLLQKDSLAVLDYTKSIEINPNFRDVYFNRGQSFLVLKKVQEACDDFYKGSIMGDGNCNIFIKKHCNK